MDRWGDAPAADHEVERLCCSANVPLTLCAEETLAAADALRDEEPTSFLDRVFANEINVAVHRTRAAYDRLLFREALKMGWCAALCLLHHSGCCCLSACMGPPHCTSPSVPLAQSSLPAQVNWYCMRACLQV